MLLRNLMCCGALAAAISCQANILIDNYRYAGVSNPDLFEQPGQPWLDAAGNEVRVTTQESLDSTQVIGGNRRVFASTALFNDDAFGSSMVGVLDMDDLPFSPNEVHGLYMSVYTSPSGYGEAAAFGSITYGFNPATTEFNYVKGTLDLDVIGHFGGALPSEGGFLLDVQSINVTEAPVTLSLGLYSGDDTVEYRQWTIYGEVTEDLFWSFEMFSETDFSDIAQITLQLGAGTTENFGGWGDMTASSFSIVSSVPEPSTYALLLGLGSLGFLIHRKLRITNS